MTTLFEKNPAFMSLPANTPMIPIALHMDRIILWAFVIFNATFALSGIVRSTGAVWPPLLILVTSMLLIRVPFAYFMIPHWGRDAIWWSFPLGTITSSALTTLYYKYGGWRKVRMLHHMPGAEIEDVPQALPVGEAAEREGSMSGEVLAS